MAWSKKKTFRVLLLVLILSFVFMIANIVLVILNVEKGKRVYYSSVFISFVACVYGTGFGCISFRLIRSKAQWPHIIIHTIVPFVMIGGRRQMFSTKPTGKLFHLYSQTLFTVIIYVIQLILSIHLMVFRYGRTPKEKAFRSGIHAFLGVLTFFICVMEGLIQVQYMAISMKNVDLYTYLSCLCLLFYAICIWYLLLNPYFDWRRLAIMSKTEQVSRSPSKTSLRSSLSQGGRSPTRSEARR